MSDDRSIPGNDSSASPARPSPRSDDAQQINQRAASSKESDHAQNPGAIRSGNLAGRSLPFAIVVLALPILLEQFANAFVTLVDNTLTGNLPEGIAIPALDGVGVASYMSWFIGVSMSAIGVGGMALIARAIGGGNIRLAERALGQAFTFGILWGCVIGLFIWLITPPLTVLAHLSPDATKYCIQYTNILAAGLPISATLMISMTCLHGAGETARPFFIMLAVNIVNIFASFLLSGVDINVQFGSFHIIINNPLSVDWYVIGIAAGTVIGQAVGCILIIILMVKGAHGTHLRLRDMAPDLSTLFRIIRIGVPSFFDGFGMWAGQLIAVFWVIGEIARRTGEDVGLLGSHLITIRWEAFSFMPGFAMGVAAGTLAGQFLGAGNKKMAVRAVIACTVVGMILMGSAGLIFIFEGETLTRIISDNPIHLQTAPRLLFICGLVQVAFAVAMVIRGALRGAGDTTASMLITWFSTYAIRIPLCWLFGIVLGYGLTGVWIGLSLELLMRSLLFLGRFLQGNWKNIKV